MSDEFNALIGIMPNVVVFDDDGVHVVKEGGKPELPTIEAVMAAARAAFGERPTQKQVVDIACGLVGFLKNLEELPSYHRPIDVREWRERIENLRLYLGPASVDKEGGR